MGRWWQCCHLAAGAGNSNLRLPPDAGSDPVGWRGKGGGRGEGILDTFLDAFWTRFGQMYDVFMTLFGHFLGHVLDAFRTNI